MAAAVPPERRLPPGRPGLPKLRAPRRRPAPLFSAPDPNVPPEHKLPWFEAVCVVLPLLPYVRHLTRPGYRNHPNPATGLCYVASEAIFHLSEDPLEPWWIRYGPRAHQTHWFLKHTETGQRIDVTGSQFGEMDAYAMYTHERRRAFGTTYPSKRTQELLTFVDRKRAHWKLNFGQYTFEAAEKRYDDALEWRPAWIAHEKGDYERALELTNAVEAKRRAGDSNATV
jgi:hypothetical protein